MRRLRIGDKTLRVRDEPEPAPDARRAPVPLVCVHGAGMSSVVWMDAVRRLAPARRVVALDLPGHGQSDGAPEPGGAASLAIYCAALDGVCTQLGLGRVVLVGHSLGGAVALAEALARPERVAGLVLVNSAAQLAVSPEVFAELARVFPIETAADGKEWVDRLPSELGDLFFSPATHKDGRERWQAMLLSATRQTVRGDFQAGAGFDVRARLGELKVPTLVVGGQDDLLVTPQALAATAAQIAGAKLQLVPDTGHLTHLEQPEKFLSLLTEFLQGVR